MPFDIPVSSVTLVGVGQEEGRKCGGRMERDEVNLSFCLDGGCQEQAILAWGVRDGGSATLAGIEQAVSYCRSSSEEKDTKRNKVV